MLSKPAGGKEPPLQPWPLSPPHMKSNFRRIRIGLIGNDAPSKRICFSPAMSRSKALKMLQWYGNDGDESRLAIRAF
jgi:hypothetical protein